MLLVGRYAEKQRPRPRQAWDSRRRQYPLRSTDDAHASPFPGPISSRDRGSDSRAAVSRPASSWRSIRCWMVLNAVSVRIAIPFPPGPPKALTTQFSASPKPQTKPKKTATHY